MDLGSERPKRSFWQKVKDVALTDVGTMVKGIDEETISDLERLLLQADFGVDATMELVEELERAAKRGSVSTEGELRELLAREIQEILTGADAASPELRTPAEGPGVVLLLGVNGTGKTTTAGKLAHRCRERGESVTMAATDTFRAGAQDQLREWAERAGADFVGGESGADPASVAYDAVEAAVSRGVDRVLVDTAGRLHTQRDLLEELQKIDRVVGRLVDGAPHERFLVVDATSGQNVIQQAEKFGEAVELSGLVLTKFDSTGSGGSAVAVARELSVPVRFLGTGEQLPDLEPFDAERYTRELLGAA